MNQKERNDIFRRNVLLCKGLLSAAEKRHKVLDDEVEKVLDDEVEKALEKERAIKFSQAKYAIDYDLEDIEDRTDGNRPYLRARETEYNIFGYKGFEE